MAVCYWLMPIFHHGFVIFTLEENKIPNCEGKIAKCSSVTSFGLFTGRVIESAIVIMPNDILAFDNGKFFNLNLIPLSQYGAGTQATLANARV